MAETKLWITYYTTAPNYRGRDRNL